MAKSLKEKKEELKKARAEAEAEIFSLAKERDIFKLSLQGKKPDEIAGELQLSVEYVNSVLNME